MTSPNELADRYVELWSEPDAERRRERIAELWTEDAVHLLQPPEEIREIAARPGLAMNATLEARGHAALEARVTSAYQEFIAPGAYSFRRRGDAERVGDVVRLGWEMVTVDGEVAGSGTDFLVLAPEGRIRRDYQFVDG